MRILESKPNSKYKMKLLTQFIITLIICICSTSCWDLERLIFPPFLSMESVVEAGVNKASARGSIDELGTNDIIEFGFCWSSESKPTIEDEKKVVGTQNETGQVNAIIENLQPNTTYYVRLYATTADNVSHYSETEVTIFIQTSDPYSLMDSVTTITDSEAHLWGQIVSLGTTGHSIVEHGFCWSTNSNPQLWNSDTTLFGALTVEKSINQNIKNLSPATVYYAKCFVVDNQSNVFYSNVISFTTAPAQIPVVITGDTSNVTTSTAIIQGQITDLGTANNIISYGHVWSKTNTLPEVGNSDTTNLGSKNTTGSFFSSITNLSPNSLYYIRAYAISSEGIGYGLVKTFTTKANAIPSLIIGTEDNLNTTSVDILNSQITYAGTSTVTEYGICWSTSDMTPDINDNKIPKQTNTTINSPLNYNQTLNNLPQGTLIYLRAYAINNSGPGYSSAVLQVTTLATNSWNSLSANVPSALVGRRFAVSFVIGNNVYIGLGENASGTPLDDFWKYNFITEVWTSIGTFPGGKRTGAVAFSGNGNGYVTMGKDENGNYPNDLWAYDGNSWNSKTAPNLTCEHSIAVVNGNDVYVGTGRFTAGYVGGIKKYNLSTNVWSTVTTAPFSKAGTVSFILNGNIYVGTGIPPNTIPVNAFNIYNISGNSWSNISPFPIACAHASSCIINGIPYVGFGGLNTSLLTSSSDWYKYDIANDQWLIQTPISGTGRYGAVCFSRNGRAYIFGGTTNGSNALKDFWEYIP